MAGGIHDLEAFEQLMSDIVPKSADALVMTENPPQRKMRRLRHEIVEIVFEKLRLEKFLFSPSDHNILSSTGLQTGAVIDVGESGAFASTF